VRGKFASVNFSLCGEASLQFRDSKPLLEGYAALMLEFVLRFWLKRYRANPRPSKSGAP
jgi:hypothetical protein